MKTYMPLNGLRWSRNSGSANCDMPQSAVFGRPGGGLSRICEHYGAPTSDTLITPTIDFNPHLASPVGEGQILSVV